MRFPRGKYKGYGVEGVPSDYLIFVINHPEATPELKNECRRVLADRLGIEPVVKTIYTTTSGLSKEKLKTWYRKASLVAHPDRGGSVAMMKLLNELMEM